MHARELPKPFHRDGWVYEEKYDGWRMVAEKVGSEVTLTSRNGLDHTRRFPELVKAVAELDAPSLVLDGEIAIFDSQLISRFEWLRARPKNEVATPPIYMVFDLLELGGEDLRTRALHERRQALEQLATDRQLVMPTRRLPANGLEAWEESCEATTRAWSPRTLRQPTSLAARSRGSRSSSEAIVERLEGSTSPAHLAQCARPARPKRACALTRTATENGPCAVIVSST
jgi:hypothetical protein